MRPSAKLATTALAAFTLTAFAQSHHEAQWDSGHRTYTPWKESFCKLQLVDAYHPNNDQPVHLLIRNASSTRLRYRLSVAVLKGGRTVFTGSVSVDNANPGEQSDAQTAAYRGILAGSTIVARVDSCSIPS